MPSERATEAAGTVPLFASATIEPGLVTVSAAEPLRRWLSGDHWASYPSAVDLTQIPRAVALLPALYALAPVAWASGGSYAVEGLDQPTAAALPAVRDELRRSYPALPWDGEVVALQPVPVADPPEPRADAALLFSTGVDSTASAIRHAEERLILVSVGLDDDLPPSRWDADMAEARRFARESGKEHVEVRTNARSFVSRTIWTLHPSIKPWWPMVGHGMAFLGIAAPVAYSAGARRLYIAATHSAGFEREWGSTPRLDPLVAVGQTKVVHDGYDLTRLARVQTIVDGLGLDGRTVALRVCHVRDTPEGARNCGVCEKCVRSQVSLVVAGADPRAFGFPAYEPGVLESAQRSLEGGAWKIDKGLAIYWQELADGASIRLRTGQAGPERTFLEWLSSYQPVANVPPRRRRAGSAGPQRPSPMGRLRRCLSRARS